MAEGVALEDVGDVLVSIYIYIYVYLVSIHLSISIYVQVSNMMTFPGPLELGWARVASVHCVGSFWAPGFANYLLLFQVRIIYWQYRYRVLSVND